jgi:hypothetical protein
MMPSPRYRCGSRISRWAAHREWIGGIAEAGPVFGDDDAVSRLMRVVADGAGIVEANVVDVEEVFQRGYVLGALVDDSGIYTTLRVSFFFISIETPGRCHEWA